MFDVLPTNNRKLNWIFALFLVVAVIATDLKVLSIRENPHRVLWVIVFTIIGTLAVAGIAIFDRRAGRRRQR